jgi:hypothetical protein
MKIITSVPVVVNENPTPGQLYYSSNGTANGGMDDFFDIDGTNQNEVKEFQTYANTRGANLVVDGLYYRKDGKKSQTAYAYDMFGADWEKSRLGNVNAYPGGAMPPPYSPSYIATQPTGIPYSPQYIASQQSKGLTWDKVKGVWTKAKDLGLIDKGKEFLMNWTKGKQPDAPIETQPIEAEKKGMNNTTKILIGVGVVAVVVAIIFSVSKSHK